uniref:DDE_Tnp_1_7 domain-containing protein n=1 Tax=Haemonchus contortus TaxID=6289 RepID=A0A7I4Z224_HAECO
MGSMADDAALLERCFDDLLLESDAEDLYEPEEEEGLVAAVVRDLEDFDTHDTDEGDSDSDTEDNIWTDDACCNDRWVFNEPTGAHQDVEYCETPLDFYELFFSEELPQMVATQTNIYGHQKSRSWKETDIEELKRFFGLCLQMSRCPLDNQRNYWSPKPRNLARNGHSMAGDIMVRDRFEQLQRNLYFADNSKADRSNKLYKIQPILDYLNAKFQRMYKPEKELCIDESMVPFRGRASFWQYSGAKRHRFGIKLFKLCSRAGYTLKVKVYAGKDPKRTRTVAESVVMELMDGFLKQGRCLCTDNWYTSSPLAHRLLKRRTDLVGTLGRNRKGLPTALKDKKLKRGEIFYQQNQRGVLILKWRDRRIIHMLPTKHDARCQPDGKPAVVADYNMMKGFVNLSDQMAAYTPYLRKTSKWYIRLFYHLITQTALVNAWFHYCEKVKKNQDQLLQGINCRCSHL